MVLEHHIVNSRDDGGAFANIGGCPLGGVVAQATDRGNNGLGRLLRHIGDALAVGWVD